MKWIIKAYLQHALGRLPARLADPIYHGIQQGRRRIPTDIESQRPYAQEIAALVARVRGTTLAGLRIVELGSGWYPVLPLLLVREFGAAAVHTVDVNRHYSSARIAAAAREIMALDEHLRADPVLHHTALTGQLPDSVHYYPRSDIAKIGTSLDAPADLAVSRSVLEYIPPETLCEIHLRSHQWLAPHALWIHLIGTSDDRARQDKKLHPFDFLRYSDAEWLRIGGNRYAYKNRLRLPQYRSLFESAGWDVKHEEYSVSDSATDTLHGVPIHPDFQRFSDQELVAGSIRFALARSDPA